MRRLLLAVCAVFFFSWSCFAQTSTDDTPATKADVQRYLQIAASRDMMKKMMVAISQSTGQVMHEQYLKHKDQLPADYESKMTAEMDEMLANMPWDEITEAMIPAYQKHLTKGDVDNLVAFYSSPTGAKILREMPALVAESMQSAMPVMMKYMDTVKQTLMKKTEVMIAESKKSSGDKAPATHN